MLERSHSLQTYPAQRLALAYRRARRDAITVTGLPASTFPEACPWQGVMLFVLLLVVLGLLWLIRYLPERTYLVHLTSLS